MKTYTMIFAGMLTLASCNGGNKQTDNVETSQCDVDTEMVELYEMDDELVLNGNVVCDETCLCKVFVPCTGRVTDLKVEVGDKVSRGQLLAVIKSEGAADYRKSISDADAEIRMAERWFAMQQDLRGSGMASDKDVEEARERVMTAHAERLRLNDVASINGFGDGANASLMAPISGYVICKRIYNNS